MRKWRPRLLAIAPLILFSAIAAGETANLKVLNAGSGPIAGGVWTSPYGIGVNGVL